jgi:nucleoside-diphosphate-sugar epimerase
MKIAVLGARGFLGTFLVKYLSERGFEVLPVTRETVNLEQFHAVDFWLKKNLPDVVINCAISGGGAKVNDINYSDVQRDLVIFLNFYNNTRVKKYINIGSGAEYDRRKSISNAKEEDILHSTPIESYSFTKNIIARMCLEKSNYYTLRLFGCFDRSEPSNRLFKKFLANKDLPIQDRYFDFISATDFGKIIDYYCSTDSIKYKDINCVYEDKYRLSEILWKFSKNSARLNLTSNELALPYTGMADKLASLNINFDGLCQGLENYE